ncbi:hypothetical protein SNK03_005366 [Fusarium graminearum]
MLASLQYLRGMLARLKMPLETGHRERHIALYTVPGNIRQCKALTHSPEPPTDECFLTSLAAYSTLNLHFPPVWRRVCDACCRAIVQPAFVKIDSTIAFDMGK